MNKEFNMTEWMLKSRLNESPESDYPSYMYSPVGFGCHVCKYHYLEEEKHMCKNEYYQKYISEQFPELKDPAELVDNEGNPIKDPSKWCSNWFMPKGK
jgi:hypothetical protein